MRVSPPFGCVVKFFCLFVNTDVFTKLTRKILLSFLFSQKTGVLRKSGFFISFSLVYTNILEQKRIAGQA
jgi:hypothetical protein